MKKLKEVKSSFLHRFVIYFIFMIIIPMLCIWWIYEKVLNSYYAENTLATQQINMENSLSILDSSLNATTNVFIALKGNQEIGYYLDYTASKSNMLYGTFKSIHSFCEELYLMTPYLSSLKIYSDSPLLIYAGPFVKMENMKLDEDILNELENAGLDEIVWRVAESETEAFPAVYAYQKIYSRNYLKRIGYVEIQLSPQLLEDYFEMVEGLSGDSDAVLTLYHGNTPIYSTSPEEAEPMEPEEQESGYEISVFQNQYRNYLRIPELNLCLTCSGRFFGVNILPSSNVPSIFISILIVMLLVLFIAFFMNIVVLARRIQAFSSFIRYSNPENLSPFHPEKKEGRRADELDELIDAYNALIRENNSLISQIEKMELFTQDARFQALQGQIHPHFIYGTLETIRMMALQNKDKEAADMIFSLSSLIRYSISISSKSVTLKDEVEIARHYLKIQKIRFGERIDYSFRIDEKLLELPLPSFILQPILENAIVYGISQTLENCELLVEAHEDEEKIAISVANTGLLITPERLLEVNELLSGGISPEDFSGNRNGLALYNIKERFAIFYAGRAEIRLALEDRCTVTAITVEK